MDWTPGGISSDIEDRRGDSGGGFGFGGGGLGLGGFILLVIISLITGHNYLGSLFSTQPQTQTQQSPGYEQQGSGGSVQESPAEHRDVQLVSWVLDDVQKTWTTVLPQQTGRDYRHAKLVLFRGQTRSGCGEAQEATGPFYCPEDERVYIDLDFWDDLRRLGGDTADFAQAYVIAHELGHHVQNILGPMAKVTQAEQSDRSQRSRLSVELELQADCYAGVWGHMTEQRGIVHPQDIADALRTAAAVGDDHIQKMERGTVSPENFTHGTSAEREAWFRRGLNTGRVDACNTFQAGPDGAAQ